MSICGAIGGTEDGLVVFCELAPKHGGNHDVLLTAEAEMASASAGGSERWGEHFSWPNEDPPREGLIIQSAPSHWRWDRPHRPRLCLLCWAERLAVMLGLASYEE